MGIRANLTSKGQVTVPKSVRDALALANGDGIEFVIDGRRAYIVPRNRRVADLAGILHRPGMKAATLEEMDEAIGRAVAEDNDRIMNDWR